MTHTNPIINQQTFRGREDSGNEATPTWIDIAGNDWTQVADADFRVRFLVQETAGATTPPNLDLVIWYNHAGGGWAAVTTTTPVQFGAFTDATDADATTAQIGGGSFVAGELDSDASVSTVALSSQETEMEYCLTIDSGQVTNADTILLRVYNGTSALDNYADEPTITVNSAVDLSGTSTQVVPTPTQAAVGVETFSGAGAQVGVWTNELTRSQELDHTDWSSDGFTLIDADAAVAPDGSTTAERIIDDASTGSEVVTRYQIGVTTIVSSDHTYSIYAKADQLSWMHFRTTGAPVPGDRRCWFDLTLGATGTTNSPLRSAISDAGNGWWRCSVTFLSDEADTSIRIHTMPAEGDAMGPVDLDGTSSIFLWGAQSESGSGPTEYIETVAAAVTRVAVSQDGVGVETFSTAAVQDVPVPTQAAAGVETFSTAAVQDVPVPTQAAAATSVANLDGNAAQDVPVPTQAAAGTHTENLDGNAVQNVPVPTQAAAGVETMSAVAVTIVATPTQAALGVETISGAGSQSINTPSQLAAGLETISGTAVQDVSVPTMTATGVETLSAAAVTTIATPTKAAIGSETFPGDGAQTIPIPTLDAVGVVTNPIEEVDDPVSSDTAPMTHYAGAARPFNDDDEVIRMVLAEFQRIAA